MLCCRSSQLYMSQMCKGIFRLCSFWQNIKFSRNYPKFHIFTKIVIFQVGYNCIFYTNCFIPINFMAGTCQKYSFCQLWAVNVFRIRICIYSQMMIMKFIVVVVAAAVLAKSCDAISKTSAKEDIQRKARILDELTVLLEKRELVKQLRDLLNEETDKTSKKFLFGEECSRQNCINGQCFGDFCYCGYGWSGDRCDVPPGKCQRG